MSEACKYKRYIWELPVRWSHWVNVTSIVILAVTGFFIGTPVSFGSSASDFTMGWIRFVHFLRRHQRHAQPAHAAGTDHRTAHNITASQPGHLQRPDYDHDRATDGDVCPASSILDGLCRS